MNDPSAECTVKAVSGPGFLKYVDGTLDVVCVALILLTVLVALLQVFFRYVMNASLSWPEEFARWAFVWVVFLGMALAYRRDSHISIDTIVRLLPRHLRTVHAAYVDIAVVATCVALFLHGYRLALRTSYVSPALGWNFTFFYLAVPAGAAVNLFYALFRRTETERRLLALLLRIGGGVLLYVLLQQTAPLFRGVSSSLILVSAAVVLVFTGVPIAYSLTLSSYLAFFPGAALMLLTVSHNLASALNSFILLAIPFFILTAAVMNVGGITTRLMSTAGAFVGHKRGGLGHVNVVTSVMLGGITGSSSADAGATSKILVPEMTRHGYHPSFSCAVTASSSVLANMIPPSLSLIMYAALASVSVGALFIATIVPGLLMALVLALVVHVVSVRRGYGSDADRATGRQKWLALRHTLPALVLPVGIVGGVRFGVFTATEAGAVAVLYACIVSFSFYTRPTLRQLAETARDAMMDTVSIMFIVAAASPFAWVLVSQQVPQRLAEGLTGLIGQPVLLLLAINGFLLLVGLFIELFAALVILVPLFMPIIMQAGVDPIHFGIIMCTNLVLGALTPPLGVLAFVTARITRTDVLAVFRALVPFLLGMIAVLLLITYIPALSLTLPQIIRP